MLFMTVLNDLPEFLSADAQAERLGEVTYERDIVDADVVDRAVFMQKFAET